MLGIFEANSSVNSTKQSNLMATYYYMAFIPQSGNGCYELFIYYVFETHEALDHLATLVFHQVGRRFHGRESNQVGVGEFVKHINFMRQEILKTC